MPAGHWGGVPAPLGSLQFWGPRADPPLHSTRGTQGAAAVGTGLGPRGAAWLIRDNPTLGCSPPGSAGGLFFHPDFPSPLIQTLLPWGWGLPPPPPPHREAPGGTAVPTAGAAVLSPHLRGGGSWWPTGTHGDTGWDLAGMERWPWVTRGRAMGSVATKPGDKKGTPRRGGGHGRCRGRPRFLGTGGGLRELQGTAGR